ncbi:amidohydrolase [Acinetobacter ursingii]|uniref:amidohydrolase n=1 Tax=Acinetobacter ursingii TaxID=108980 RepID=UPI001250A20D|nr:amidohydrolase [Acinetobacter ursingii]
MEKKIKPAKSILLISMISILSACGDQSDNTSATVLPVVEDNGEAITIYPAKKVITMEQSSPDAFAVSVRGKTIIGVGTIDQLKQQAGKSTVSINDQFKDKIIMPGFIDQHLHPVLGALTLSSEIIAPEDWELPAKTFKAATTSEEYLSRLTQAESNLTDPTAPLISWGYHKLWHGPLDRAALDKISATRPIIIWQRSCHEVYLNTAALNLLNIKKEDFDNLGAAKEMLDYEAGHFWEQGFMETSVMPKLLNFLATPQRMMFGLKQMIAYTHANGVTAYNEPGAVFTPEMWKLYQYIFGAEDTPMYSTFIPDGRAIVNSVGLDNALAKVEETVALAPESSGKKVWFFPKQIKLFADGAVVSQLMQMKDPYTDGHHGEWMIEPEDLERRAKLFWDAGYQIHIHVNGDLGAEVVLATLKKRIQENPRMDHRFVVVHFANSTDQQVAELAKNGAIFSVNPYYPVGFADKFEEGLGRDRADTMVRSASILKNTPHLSFHSDLPIAPSAPLYLAWSGVNRVTTSGRLVGPEQRISVNAALRAITIEAAYSWRQEDKLGSIKAGKIANFTVLDQDPYQVDPMKLKDIPLSATIFEGRIFPIAPKQGAGSNTLAMSKSYKIRSLMYKAELATHSHHESDNCQLALISQQIAKSYAHNLKKQNT